MCKGRAIFSAMADKGGADFTIFFDLWLQDNSHIPMLFFC